MKEFEKIYGTKEEAIEGYGWRDIGEYYNRRKGWIAALRWVREMSRDNELHGADIKIWDEIDQELKEEE